MPQLPRSRYAELCCQDCTASTRSRAQTLARRRSTRPPDPTARLRCTSVSIAQRRRQRAPRQRRNSLILRGVRLTAPPFWAGSSGEQAVAEELALHLLRPATV